METFHPGKLEKPHHHHHYYHHHHHHHHQPVEFLPGASRFGAKGHHPHPGNAFNSWNDYLGLATLVTKAVGQDQGFRDGPSSVVVAAAVQQVQAAVDGEEDDEDDEDEEEEEEEEEEEGTPYFENSLDLHDFALCGHHHHHHHHLSPGESLLEERFAGFSPFSGRSSPASGGFSGSPEPFLGGEHQQQQQQQRDRSPHAWGGPRVGLEPRLPAAPRRLLKPALQVCVFCRNNKEAVALYTTHILKGPDGRVLCPVLRRYTCPLCGASGDNAHTIKYCPLSKMHAKQPLKNARHLLGKKLR